MSLPDAFVGARHTGLEVTWEHSDHTPYDLTDATVSAEIKNKTTGQKVPADGIFTITSPTAGLFTWEFGVLDVSTAGVYSVQFQATYADDSYDVSVPRDWKVLAF
jgi:hypothetical protein